MFFFQSFQNNFSRFRKSKRGYYSVLILFFFVILSLFSDLWINSRAWMVKYQGEYFFPLVQGFLPEKKFGGLEESEANYRNLKIRWEQEKGDNFVLLAPIPYNAYESDFDNELGAPPYPPSFKNHLLGTDTLGRDIMARLVFAFRITFIFSFVLYVLNTIVGVAIGSAMGYVGGWFDLFFQRFIEIWSNLPLLYILVILGSILNPSLLWLLIIFSLLNWTGITWLIRAEILREKKKTYALKAASIGLSKSRILFFHLLPNAMVPIIVNLPFAMIGGIGILTSLDFLGYGLPIPTPSWGELLKQGQETFEFAPWIILAPSLCTVGTLLLFSFIGETLRDSFDPKKMSSYF